MNYRKRNTITAILTVAVISVGLLFSSCCTKRDVKEIMSRLNRVESQNAEMRQTLAAMDSLVTSAAESNRQLQNDVRYSTDELVRMMNQLLENHNDLIARIDMLASQRVIRAPLQSSPGAMQPSPATVDTGLAVEEPPPAATPSVACIDQYDNAFTQVRRGEYETAVESFRKYLEECPNHEDVENAFYWIGECYYSQQQYTQAIAEYEKLLEAYPNSPNVGRALYKLARCQQEIGKKDEARRLFQRLVEEHAGTLEAEQAAQRLKDL